MSRESSTENLVFDEQSKFESQQNLGNKIHNISPIDDFNISTNFLLKINIEIFHDKVSINQLERILDIDDPSIELKSLAELIKDYVNALGRERTPSEDSAINWRPFPKMAMAIRDITKLIPEYKGDEKGLDIFIKKVNKLWTHIAEYEENDKNQFLLVLQLKLTDKAAEAVQNNEFDDWDNVKEALIEHITPHRNTEKSELKLSSIRQKPDEEIEKYAKRIEEALDTLNRSFPEEEQNEVIKRENNRKAR